MVVAKVGEPCSPEISDDECECETPTKQVCWRTVQLVELGAVHVRSTGIPYVQL
jgi:hypothetical protein